MKFFLRTNNNLIPVKLMNQPSDTESFTGFQKVNGTGYSGTSDQFALLKFDKKTKKYTAFGIVRNIVPMQTDDTPIVPMQIEEPQTEEVIEQISSINEIRILELKTEPKACKQDEEYRKFTFLFQPRMGSKVQLFEDYKVCKQSWINMFGSPQLKLALSMSCKCDSKYIFERVALEFPVFKIFEQFQYTEIDTPDFGVLTFIKENINTKQTQLIRKFNGRIFLGYEYEKEDSKKEYLIIEGFLGMCDLACPMEEFVAYVIRQSDREGLSDFGYSISG